MEGRPDRSTMDEAQKTKLIFIAIAAVVTILLIISFVSGNNARKERDALKKEVQANDKEAADKARQQVKLFFLLQRVADQENIEVDEIELARFGLYIVVRRRAWTGDGRRLGAFAQGAQAIRGDPRAQPPAGA